MKIEREEVHTRPGVVTAKSGNAPGRGTERNGVGRHLDQAPKHGENDADFLFHTARELRGLDWSGNLIALKTTKKYFLTHFNDF